MSIPRHVEAQEHLHHRPHTSRSIPRVLSVPSPAPRSAAGRRCRPAPWHPPPSCATPRLHRDEGAGGRGATWRAGVREGKNHRAGGCGCLWFEPLLVAQKTTSTRPRSKRTVGGAAREQVVHAEPSGLARVAEAAVLAVRARHLVRLSDIGLALIQASVAALLAQLVEVRARYLVLQRAADAIARLLVHLATLGRERGREEEEEEGAGGAHLVVR